MTNFHAETALRNGAEFVARVPEPKFSGLKDLIVVKPLDQKYGIVLMAETAEGLTVHEGARSDDSDAGDAFLGVVVTTGRGDRTVMIRCKACGADSQRILDRLINSRRGVNDAHSYGKCTCGAKEFEKTGYGHLPFSVKRGDVIAMPRRPQSPGADFELELEGEKYIAFFEEQFAYFVLEAAA